MTSGDKGGQGGFRTGVRIQGNPQTGYISVEGPFHVGVEIGGTPLGMQPSTARVGNINVKSAPHDGMLGLSNHPQLVQSLLEALEHYRQVVATDGSVPEVDKANADASVSRAKSALSHDEVPEPVLDQAVGELAKKATQGAVSGLVETAATGLWFAYLALWTKLTEG